MSAATHSDFKDIVWDFYRHHERHMPWRDTPSPYYVLVSELMLQQTQVSRVIPKFTDFVATFPDAPSLAAAPLSDVLHKWQGLGYNRRARFLHESSQIIVDEHDGQIPDSIESLVSLPGIGKNTAGAIRAYAFNQPAIFVETNIRTVYFHHFFAESDAIDDKLLIPLIESTMDSEHVREWYWALMDYGTYLKSSGAGRISQSKYYKKQSAFEGSVRQMRGEILRQLLAGDSKSLADFDEAIVADDRFELALHGLEKDGLIVNHIGRWCLTGAGSPS